MEDKFKDIDKKEIQLPETTFSRDIESRVFQAIVFQCLSKIEGIGLVSKGLIDSLLGRDVQESYSAIHVEQDQKQHSVSIKIELNVKFGISIPEKAEEIQTSVIEAVSKFTGLHVNKVHIIFKNMIVDLEDDEDDDNDSEIQKITNSEEYEGF